MANKHLKKNDAPSRGEAPSKGARHTKAPAVPEKTGAPAKKGAGTGGADPDPEQVISLTKALTARAKASQARKETAPSEEATPASGGKTSAPKHTVSRRPKTKPKPPAHRAKSPARASGEQAVPPKGDGSGAKTPAAAPETEGKTKKSAVVFRRDRAKKIPGEKKTLLSHRDRAGAVISLIAAAVLLAATAVVWFYRDSFSPDGMVFSADTAAVAREEYVFDAGSGEAFAAAGKGLAVANTSGFELLDGDGTPVTSMVMQMENPTAAGCSDFAVFYDLGGRRLAVARFDGSVEELDTEGDIFSVTVSEGGYIAVTSEQTGSRALVTVYDPNLDEVYKLYSSSAWVMSAVVSPDSRKLAVLSYTASGSEIRFFRLTREEQIASFSAEGTLLLDVHWFTSDKLCALSSEQVLFFDAGGQWQNTYSFNGQYLVGYTFDGSNCAAFALSPYRAGTTAVLTALDPNGEELGTADVQSEIVCLAAADLEIMVLCSDGAILYNSSLAEKGRLNGLPGFKYGLLRNRGEALLIASNYAEVYAF